MSKKPTLNLVKPSASQGTQPPRKLGEHGMSLWRSVVSEYDLTDAGGVEMLALACAALATAGSAHSTARKEIPCPF